MFDAVKPLLVVLLLSLIAFHVARPTCLKFMTVGDFSRRRNLWLLLTCLSFLAPSFWIFAFFAVPLVFWAGSVDPHPTALYVMLMLCVPPAELPIPVPLVNQLFGLSTTRILAFALLVPAAIRVTRAGKGWPLGVAKVDVILLMYGALQLALYMQFESPTNTLRRGFLFLLDTFSLYFVFSRCATTRKSLRDTMASFWLACWVLAPITVFESAKGWLLYTNIPDRWGVPNVVAWLLRGDSLRAQASAGHSLTMGFMLAVAFGFWLFLGNYDTTKKVLWSVGIALWLALISTFSRAPWIVAAFMFIVYLFLSPGGRKHIFGTLAFVAAGLGIASITPFGAKLIAVLPFIGTEDQFNVDYRQQLATISWQLIKENPLLGNPFALGQMEELRQGQGIIDLVNTYATIALFYGVIGLSLFVTCFVYPLWRTVLSLRDKSGGDDEISNAGAALVSCMLGTLLMIGTASFGDATATIAWILVGLCSAYPLIKMSGVGEKSKATLNAGHRFSFSLDNRTS